jgi:hypothetical protein
MVCWQHCIRFECPCAQVARDATVQRLSRLTCAALLLLLLLRACLCMQF